MKDIHKSPNSNSSELKTYNANQVESILKSFLEDYNLIGTNASVDEIDVDQYFSEHSLRYKKIKDTFSYYSQAETVRIAIARQASKIIREQFNLSSPNTCYTYWNYNYGKYVLCIKYIAGKGRYYICNSNYDGKFKFETDSFKEFFNKIKTLTK